MSEQNTQNSTGETLEERLRQWEKEKRGILNDLTSEREKRQAYEKRLEEMEKALSSAASEPEVGNNQDEVSRLAARPKDYILDVVRPELESRDQRIEQLIQEKQFDKAYQWLAKQEKKDVDDIYGSDVEKEIVRISKEHGMARMSPVEGVRAAYKIYLQERAEKEKDESTRDERISNNSTGTVRIPPSSGSRKYTRDYIAQLTPSEFAKEEEAILDAQRKGLIS